MTTDILGSYTFSETPTVNGIPVLLSDSGGGVVSSVYTGTTARTTGTTLIPYDNTTPTSTEGSQLWSQTLTPASTSSTFLFTYTLDVGSSATRFITVALFRGTTCLTSRSSYVINTVRPMGIALHFVDAPATVSSITYSVRIGISSSGTWTANGSSAATMGGANGAGWSIIELS